MTQWLYGIDLGLFRWVNQSWSHPFLDRLFPFLSGNDFFYPILACLIALLWIKGGPKGRVFVCMTVLGFLLSELLVSNLKDWIARPRPFMTLPPDDMILRLGKGGSGSMPSSHASTWFVGAIVAWIYWRSSRFWLPLLAAAVAISRVYNGVHYPSDIFVGACIGIGCGVLSVYGGNFVWKNVIGKYIPLFTQNIPDLLILKNQKKSPQSLSTLPLKEKTDTNSQYLWLGYFLIGAMLIFRWVYLWAGKIELSEDEAYQWVWSKYLALSYFSKPPMIAYTQWLGTHLWGDTMLGVRFFSPICSAITSFLLLRFLDRQVGARIGFFVVMAGMLAPLLAVGSILMTVDPLAVLFWTAVLVCSWKAIQEDSLTSWIWTGIWIGFGFLSKYSTPLLLFSWAFFFLLSKPARKQLKKPGIYMALGISLLFSLPVLIWNYQNDWISYHHVVEHGEASKAWKFTLRFFGDFTGAELGLLNPVFFFMTLWASIAFWKKRDMLTLYLFSMGGPIFAAYWLYTFHSRVLPNWIAPAVISLFALAGIYWGQLEASRPKLTRRLFTAGFIVGLLMVIPLHDSNLIQKVSGKTLPAKLDPLRRVRAWSTLAEQVEEVRERLQTETGSKFFIVADHYGLTGQLSFEIPLARESLNPPVNPLVFYLYSTGPDNQFYFWPTYRTLRVGENAVFVTEVDKPKETPPERVLNDFEKVENLGYYEIEYRGRVFRRVQLFACYNCKPLPSPQ